MRLINATTLTLYSFVDDSQVPKYAILSHTWGAGEVTFHDLRHASTSELEHKAGYHKIRLATLQTLRDKLEYLWVDKCCIDKTSSAELSESINSMFRWYEKAEICYAYLDDIAVSDNAPEPFIDEFRGLVRAYVEEEVLATAKWFTRGWTLQELLAPDRLHFYVQNWEFIGDKVYLEPKIARITGINIDALDSGNKLGNYRVATRMSWAASRITTRAEDMAYCLLGLFDVNMPLLYGEGGPKAFARLQQAVLEDSSDCSIFASVSTEDDVPSWLDKSSRLLQHDNQGGRSIFAKSPKEFKGSSDIRSSHTGEIILTSIGVKLELPLFSLSHLTSHLEDSRDPDFFIVLLCWANDHTLDVEQDSVGVVVRRCHRGRRGAPDVLLRHEGYGLIRANIGEFVEPSDFRQMYLCKKVPDGNFLRRLGHRLGHDGSGRPDEETRAYPDSIALAELFV